MHLSRHIRPPLPREAQPSNCHRVRNHAHRLQHSCGHRSGFCLCCPGAGLQQCVWRRGVALVVCIGVPHVAIRVPTRAWALLPNLGGTAGTVRAPAAVAAAFAAMGCTHVCVVVVLLRCPQISVRWWFVVVDTHPLRKIRRLPHRLTSSLCVTPSPACNVNETLLRETAVRWWPAPVPVCVCVVTSLGADTFFAALRTCWCQLACMVLGTSTSTLVCTHSSAHTHSHTHSLTRWCTVHMGA